MKERFIALAENRSYHRALSLSFEPILHAHPVGATLSLLNATVSVADVQKTYHSLQNLIRDWEQHTWCSWTGLSGYVSSK